MQTMKRLSRTEWREHEDLSAMLFRVRGKATARQLRLFACACVRRLWHLLLDERSRQALEMAEKFADGHVSQDQILAPLRSPAGVSGTVPSPSGNTAMQMAAREANSAANSCTYVFNVDASVVRVTANHASNALAWVEAAQVPSWQLRSPRWRTGKAEAVRQQCGLLRDIVHPFRPRAVDPSWLQWDRGTIARIARSIYDEGRFDDLPILADALADAGCDDEVLIAHCRQAEPHVRGCWVLDLLLEKAAKVVRLGA